MDLIVSAWLIWFVLGVAMAFLELQLPGFIVLFFGVGCWVTAGALLIWDLTVTQQIMIFIAGTVASIVLLRRMLIRMFRGRALGTDSDYDDFPTGAHARVVQPIKPMRNGRIHFRGTQWDAMADEDIEAGETVEIVSYAGDSRQAYFVRKI